MLEELQQEKVKADDMCDRLRRDSPCGRCMTACKSGTQHSSGIRADEPVPEVLWAILAGCLLNCSPALAEDVIKYDPGSGADAVKAIAGAAYVVLLAIFAVRLFQKRAKFATGEVCSTFAAQGHLTLPSAL